MNRKTITLLAATVLTFSACSHEKERSGEIPPVKVKTLTVGASSAGAQLHYSGTIEEASATSLSFSTVGTLKSIHVSEGQTVSAGQLIATVDDATLRHAYEATLATKEQALDAQERMRQLHDNGSLPEIKWIEIETQVKQALSSEQIAKKALDDARLYAPFGGYVAERSAEVGQSVAPGLPVVKLVTIGQVKVCVSVPEQEIASIRRGMELDVTVPALEGRTFRARVVEKGVSADPISRSYEVKALVANPHHELLPGMMCEVKLSQAQPLAQPHQGEGSDGAGSSQGAASGNPMTLPAEVIQIDADNKPFVWTVADGKARRTFLTLGANAGDNVVVTTGLEPGMKVIVAGQQKVSTDMKVEE